MPIFLMILGWVLVLVGIPGCVATGGMTDEGGGLWFGILALVGLFTQAGGKLMKSGNH